MEKIAYTFDSVTKIISGKTIVQESPLEPGTYLWPPDCTEVAPPASVAGKDAVWSGGRWSLVDAAVAPVVELPLTEKRKAMVASRFQAKAALLQAGLLDAVETQFVNATQMQKLAWSEAQEFYRLSPMLTSMGAALGLTDEQLDELFITAMSIRA